MKSVENPTLSAEDQAMHEEALLPPPQSIDLVRTPKERYLRRLMSVERNVAETFHENSKLRTGSIANTPLDKDQLLATRHWYFSTAYQARSGDFDVERSHELGVHLDVNHLPPGTAEGCAALVDQDELSKLMFALDVWVLVGPALYRLPPKSSILWLEQRLDAFAFEQLLSAVPPLRELAAPPRATVFVGIAPWRYMALQGPRGYRRTMLDAGALMAHFRIEASSASVDTLEVYDFFDVQLDNLLVLDGVERSIVGALVFTEEGRTR